VCLLLNGLLRINVIESNHVWRKGIYFRVFFMFIWKIKNCGNVNYVLKKMEHITGYFAAVLVSSTLRLSSVYVITSTLAGLGNQVIEYTSLLSKSVQELLSICRFKTLVSSNRTFLLV
jgi:hypothetical protein